MPRFDWRIARNVLLMCCLLSMPGAGDPPRPGKVLDEARQAGRSAGSLPAPMEDYFHDMDGGADLKPDPATKLDPVLGRNTWIVWSGGNDEFWDKLTSYTFGSFDLLKVVAYDPNKPIDRADRWKRLGLINEPCMEAPAAPDPQRFGLMFDTRKAGCPADPFEDETRYPGVKLGARGSTVPVGSLYGYASGIVGLRLFPNPDFDEAAKAKWDAAKYFKGDDALVRPYRVGMSCGFCHVGPSPVHPPADPASPQWADLSSTVGAQYMWVDRLLIYRANPDNYFFQLVHTYRPGAMDTSLISTDYINNPRTMNAVYSLGDRLTQALRWGRETLAGGQLNNKQFNDYFASGPLTRFFQKPNTSWTPRVLKDGSDSVGALGALNRVYLNIGLFSEEWLLHFNPVIGGKPITPIPIASAERNSSYWQATEAWTPHTAWFFLQAAKPDRLKDAPGGAKYLTTDTPTLDRGKTVFAETCARCHSSKAPKPAVGLDPAGCAGPGYLQCWNNYWAWTKTEDYKKQMRAIVSAPDFLDGNYLSTEARVPVTLLQTNACSPLATNALAGNIWDNFSSQSYKTLPSVGTITVHDPFTGKPSQYKMPAGGRGYTRPPSLISLWSTAPFLLNNSVGENAFEQDPSVDARMRVFQASIEQMLWPEKRKHDRLLGDTDVSDPIYDIDRTSERSYISMPASYVPESLRPLSATMSRLLPSLFRPDGGITIGPFPKGLPVNLLANLQPLSEGGSPLERLRHVEQMLKLLIDLKLYLATVPASATDEQMVSGIARRMGPSLLALNKCPDFEVNRGHYFGTGMVAGEPALADNDKRALIEFLKTF
jgi:hypothetical protein